MSIEDEKAGTKTGLLDTKRKKFKGSPVILFLIAAVILIVVSKHYFSFLEAQLFEERKSHIVEFTDKASEIVDNVIEASWHQLFACEHVIRSREIESKQALLTMLADTSAFIDKENTIVFAIDKNANYYASDDSMGRWAQTELLTANADKRQQIIADIPHKNDAPYFLFIELLEEPIAIGDMKSAITHLVFGIDMELMKEKISVSGFGDQCYTYLVNKDGRRIYKYTYTNNFIDGYNVINAFQNYKIVHGGTYSDFIQKMKDGENTALEFEFVDNSGRKQKWFVANAMIASEHWQLLLFVPTEVLGANTTFLMNRTTEFFIIASFLLVTMLTVIVVVTMVSSSDKRLMEQKDEANRLLKVAAENADNANKAKSDFLSHMSHDIRTPINGIMGMTDIALKHIGDEEKVLDCLHKISGSSQHLLSLVNDVLDMSRIESGKTKVNHENFDIRSCLSNCVSIISGQLATRDIELVQEFDDFEHPLLIGDELHLRQVFINILGNSVKFTLDGGKMYFRAKELENEHGKAKFRFELEDTGIGMKADFLPHLFEAFAQEDDGTRTTYKGTGLGMAITKKFVDLMGGTMEVESRLNVGTKFIIELWIDIDYETKIEDIDTDDAMDLNGMKILLVDDIELNLEIAQSILEEEGAVITLAVNGQEAFDAFTQNPIGTFDAILMDIMMPVLDGISATKAIRRLERPDSKTIPIIAMTANAYEEDIRKTKEAGMNAHLSKPIDVAQMLKTLSEFYHVSKEEAKIRKLNGINVLVADDVELNLEIARAILEEWGITVTVAKDGKEAVDTFCKSHVGAFQVILMDVNMPVLNGTDAAEQIRAADREDADIPIFAMTGDVYEEDIQRVTKAGMNGHLAKPLEAEKLLAALLDCLQKKETNKK